MTKIDVFALAVTSLAVGAFAQASPPPKYRVTEVAAPSATTDTCLPGYAISMTGGGVSDRGTVPGNILCYGNVNVGNGVVLPSRSVTQAFVWSRFAGAMEVAPPPESSTPTLFNIDSHGTVYGWMGDSTGINGMRWTPWAGFETVITRSPDCFLNISFAIAGNAAGNIAGAAYRQNGTEFPTEWTCDFRWVFRDALGTEIVGPQQSQTPSRMNQHNVVVGQVNQSAVKWLPQQGNAVIMLDQASPGFMSYALGINNRNVVVGMAGVDAGQAGCWSDAVGMVWGRDNEGRSLPSLPRLTNSEAWSIDDEGTVYGLSSTGADSCAKRSWEANRGTIWRHFRTYDLNKLLIGPPTVTITNAAHVSSKGQILAYGFRTRDPVKDCPELGASPDDGAPILIPQKCRDQRLYLLTPL
jgi:hypothetical protein